MAETGITRIGRGDSLEGLELVLLSKQEMRRIFRKAILLRLKSLLLQVIVLGICYSDVRGFFFFSAPCSFWLRDCYL
jgi:hypothetical protein